MIREDTLPLRAEKLLRFRLLPEHFISRFVVSTRTCILFCSSIRCCASNYCKMVQLGDVRNLCYRSGGAVAKASARIAPRTAASASVPVAFPTATAPPPPPAPVAAAQPTVAAASVAGDGDACSSASAASGGASSSSEAGLRRELAMLSAEMQALRAMITTQQRAPPAAASASASSLASDH